MKHLLTSLDSQWSGVSRTRYDYTYTTLAQRQTAKQSGDLTTGAFADFGDATTYNYAYNARGELVDATDYLGTDVTNSANQLSGRHFAYGFDSIGNRSSASHTGAGPLADTFTPNNLNQYVSRENNVAHTAGTAQAASAIAVTGGTTASGVGRQGRYWDAEVTLNNPGGPASAALTVTATLAGSPTLVKTDATHTAFLAAASRSFTYDDDGNLTLDGVWNYTYDAENRLVQMTTTGTAVTAGFPNRTLEFKYDYLGRRVQKRSENLSAIPNTDVYRRYLYDGDNLVAEFDATSSSCGNLLRSYTWGLDLAGSLTATGGVGALVQITDHATSTAYFPTFDGNGNIASLLKASDGTVAAAYEYSPFGELLRCAGSYATSNPFRFSTKFTDDESGLVYYGQRYYSPGLGRFINRDPIEEAGGLNLYGFCGNDGVNGIDYLGNSWLSHLWNNSVGWLGKHIAQNWNDGGRRIFEAAAATIAFGPLGGLYVLDPAARPYINVVASIAVAMVVGTLAPEFLPAMSPFWTAVSTGAAAGFAGGFTGSVLSGQGLGSSLKAGLIGGAIGGVVGGLSQAMFSPSTSGASAATYDVVASDSNDSNASLAGISAGSPSSGSNLLAELRTDDVFQLEKITVTASHYTIMDVRDLLARASTGAAILAKLDKYNVAIHWKPNLKWGGKPARGAWDPEKGTIYLDPNGSSLLDTTLTLAHEGTHAIDALEGVQIETLTGKLAAEFRAFTAEAQVYTELLGNGITGSSAQAEDWLRRTAGENEAWIRRGYLQPGSPYWQLPMGGP